MKKALAVLVVCCVLFPSVAAAQIEFGVRLATSSSLGNMGPTNMQGAHFGFHVNDRFTVLGGFDFSKYIMESDRRNSISTITPFGGLKYHLRFRDDGIVTPYLRGDVFKTISRWPNMGDSFLQIVSGLLGPSQVSMTKGETEEFLKEILSPWGFTVAFGAEYLLTDSFGIGGEFGLRNSFSKAEVNVSETGSLETTKARYHDTYAAITLSFTL